MVQNYLLCLLCFSKRERERQKKKAKVDGIYLHLWQTADKYHYVYIRLTLPYFACQAKKYSNAPKGWPTRQKLTQKMELPITFPVGSWIFSNGAVIMISGS